MDTQIIAERVAQTQAILRALEPWIRVLLMPQSPASAALLDKARTVAAEKLVKVSLRDDD